MELSELIQEMFTQCKSLNLLYVEDDAEISANTAEMLKPFFHTVTLASDGAQGLEAYEAGDYDIVLTDIKMPVMDGCIMSKKIREFNSTQAIIVMSAFEEVDLFREFIEIGISKFISKPPVFCICLIVLSPQPETLIMLNKSPFLHKSCKKIWMKNRKY
jgi:CheY-like chemotaxis protein